MSDELIFVRKLPFSAILIQGQLIQVRHQPVKTKSDLFACSLSDKRIWLPIRDPNSSKKIIIVLSAYSPNVCYMAEPLTTHSDYVAQKKKWTGLCVADAFATGDIGGVIVLPSGRCFRNPCLRIRGFHVAFLWNVFLLVMIFFQFFYP